MFKRNKTGNTAFAISFPYILKITLLTFPSPFVWIIVFPATNITIEIKNGGISYIRITDNGNGMEKDDLEIAFERHATRYVYL